MATPITVVSAGGEYMESVVVLEWTAAVGDRVAAGDPLVTVETAKAATEIPAPCEGILSAILAPPGSEVPLSSVLGFVGKDVDDTRSEVEEERTAEGPPPVPLPARDPGASALPGPDLPSGRILASPAARYAAKRRGVALSTVPASSPTGRIKLRDLDAASQAAAAAYARAPADDHAPLRVVASGSGNAPPIVMIHGFGADADSWYPLESRLNRTQRILRIELPNHGGSPKRRVRDFSSLARDIRQAFDDLRLERAHLVGHSLGGACALALADIRPRQIASLALIAPGGLGPVINARFIEGMARATQPASLRPWLRMMVSDDTLISDEFVAAAMFARRDPALRQAQQHMAQDLFPDGTVGFNLNAAMNRLTCPTTIIWGREDEIIPWKDALNAPGRVGLHLFEKTGHVPHLERPEVVLDVLSTVFNKKG